MHSIMDNEILFFMNETVIEYEIINYYGRNIGTDGNSHLTNWVNSNEQVEFNNLIKWVANSSVLLPAPRPKSS